MLNIQEFQAAFSPLYFTVSKHILHGKSGYSVHTVCCLQYKMVLKMKFETLI